MRAITPRVVRGAPFESNGEMFHPAWLLGIQRADVKRIIVDQPFDWNRQAVQGSYWGAWELALGQSPDVVVSAYLRDGRVRRTAVDLTRPGDRVVTIPG